MREGMSRRQHSRMLDRERACKKVGPSVAILDPVHDAKGADSQVRTVASCVHHRYSRRGCGMESGAVLADSGFLRTSLR